MGRPPCCDKDGIKKGPWTPEEDIILASYIQEHGPGNWRSVPTNTGLLRCSKSCRLRWTNYLRPGIKRGNFTIHEERMIVHLQALLGNKWASIASYLPQRTDNDIKNYWNTHLKKKIKKFQSALDPNIASNSSNFQLINKRYIDKRILDITHQPSLLSLNNTSTYASSTENISRLLEGWMKSPPKATTVTTLINKTQLKDHESNNNNNSCSSSSNSNAVGTTSQQCKKATKDEEVSCDDLISHEEFESLLSFDNISNIAWEKLSCESTHHGSQSTPTVETLHSMSAQPPFSLFEKWLFDEASATGQVEVELMELSSMF